MMRKYVYLIFGLLLYSGSLCLADEVATTKDGRKVLLKDDQTWEYIKEETPQTPVVAVNAKYAEEAVEVWDTSLVKMRRDFSDIVALYLHYKNNTTKKVIGVSVYVSITNPFGKVVFEHTYDDEVVIEPLERMKNDTYWYFEDNPFISDEIYDRLWQIAQNGTAKIKTKVMKVIFEDGTVLKGKTKAVKSPNKTKK